MLSLPKEETHKVLKVCDTVWELQRGASSQPSTKKNSFQECDARDDPCCTLNCNSNLKVTYIYFFHEHCTSVCSCHRIAPLIADLRQSNRYSMMKPSQSRRPVIVRSPRRFGLLGVGVHSKTSRDRRHLNWVFKCDSVFKEDVHSQSQKVCEGTAHITERSVTSVGHEGE